MRGERLVGAKSEFVERIAPAMAYLKSFGFLAETVAMESRLEDRIPENGVDPEEYAAIAARIGTDETNALFQKHSDAEAKRTEEQQSASWDTHADTVVRFALDMASRAWGGSFELQATRTYERQLEMLNRMMGGQEGLLESEEE